MNCAEFLDTIATAPVQTWALPATTSLSEHRRSCERCDLLASDLERAEQGLGLMFDAEAVKRSGEHSPSLIAARARRRPFSEWINTWGRRVAIPFTFAAGVAVGAVASNGDPWWMSPARATASEVETIPLSCLDPEGAVVAAQPYMRSRGSSVSPEELVGAIVIRGTPHEISQVHDLLGALDGPNSRACLRGGMKAAPTTNVAPAVVR